MTAPDVHDAEHLAELEARLAAMDGAFAEAKGDTGSIYMPPPDGAYPAILNEFKIIEAKKAPFDLFLVIQWKIMAIYHGKLVENVYALENPERIGILKAVLERLDRVPESLAQLRPGSEFLNELLDTPAIIAVKTAVQDGMVLTDDRGRKRINVYVNERLNGTIETVDWEELGRSMDGGFSSQPTQGSDLGEQGSFTGFEPSGGTGRMYGPPDDDIPF